MLEFLQWRIQKQGTSPGSLIYSGPRQSFTPQLTEYAYDQNGVEVQRLGDAPPEAAGDGRTHLLHLVGVHDGDMVARLGQRLGIHPLIMEDIMNTGQRPKFHIDDDALFLVFKDVNLDEETGRLHQQQVGFYWLDDTILAFQEHETTPWSSVLGRLERGTGRIRSAGPSYLAVALIDDLVDKYYAVLGQLNLRAENVEAKLADRQTEDTLMELYELKREVVLLRTTFADTRDSLEKLTTQDICDIPEQNRPYLADVRDHAQQVVDTATALHEILSDMLNIQISMAGMRMNSVMKVLTVISTIFIPLTFLSGIYGMNFRIMPELGWAYGYPAVLGVMALSVALMIWYFKRKDWF